MYNALGGTKRRIVVFIEDLSVDLTITIAIVGTLVLFGEPLGEVIASPLFILLTAASLGHLAHKVARTVTVSTYD